VTLHDATPTAPAALAQRFDLLAADATEYALFLTDPDDRTPMALPAPTSPRRT
jgi:hypothetical protein